MSTQKQISSDSWQEQLQILSSGNKGRKAAISAQGMTIVENKPFRDIEYDPIGKGNDLILTLGGKDDSYFHKVLAPVEILINREDNGVISSLEIIDQNGETTFLRLLN